MKQVLATIVGLIAASATVFIVEKIGHTIFPMPDFIDSSNMESIKSNIESIPKGNMVFVAIAHGLGILVGMFVAGIIAKTSMIPSYIVGGLMVIISIAYYFLIPSPTWFVVVDLASIITGFIVGKKLALGKTKLTKH
ncbi:MAG: hypothetical protein HKO92_08570 [Flavobacteriaceae bacterium]|nr:hypothetical protein [Flavobacteriaceae bacterium]